MRIFRVQVGKNCVYFGRQLPSRVLEIGCGDKIEFYAVTELAAACKEAQWSLSSTIQMWRSLVTPNLHSFYSFSEPIRLALDSAPIYERLAIVQEEIELWKDCIKLQLKLQLNQRDSICNRLADMYKWIRCYDSISGPWAIFDNEINMWNTLLLDLAPGISVNWGLVYIPQYLEKAIKSKADAMMADHSLQRVIEVWKDARERWLLISLSFIHGPPKFNIEIKKCIDDASALIQLLEDKS